MHGFVNCGEAGIVFILCWRNGHCRRDEDGKVGMTDHLCDVIMRENVTDRSPEGDLKFEMHLVRVIRNYFGD